MKRVDLYLEDELYYQIKDNCHEGNMSEYIRDALKEKLGIEKAEVESTYKVVRQIEKLDPASLKKKLVDIQLLNQFLFEEQKRQNEMLKLILRRASLGATFSAKLSNKFHGDEETLLFQQEAVERVNNEIKKIEI